MTEYLTTLIDDYISPILKFGDAFINKEGHIQPIGSVGEVYKFENKRYTPDGANGEKFTIPTIPFKDEDYLRIKSTDGFEVFNPFNNIKHTTLLALLVKDKLVEYFYLNDAKDSDDGVDIDNFFDDDSFENEPISFYNINELDGQVSVVFSNNKDPKNPKEIAKVTGTEMPYMIWCLCVEAIKKCTKLPKQFDNTEKAWKHISSYIKEWDRQRKKIANNIKEEHEVEVSSFEIADEHEVENFDDSDFVFEDDVNDYLFNHFGQMVEDEGSFDIDDMNLSGSYNNRKPTIEPTSSLDDMVLMF